MAITKKYKFGGLDIMSSDLNRGDARATQIKNLLINHSMELESRPGQLEFDAYEREGDTSLDCISFISRNLEGQEGEELLVFSADSATNKMYAQRVNADLSVDRVPCYGTFSSLSGSLPWASTKNILYFLANGQLMKYDGIDVSPSGIVDPVTSFPVAGQHQFAYSGSGANIYVKSILMKFDAKGNLTASDWARNAGAVPFGAYGTTLNIANSSGTIGPDHKFITITALSAVPTCSYSGFSSLIAGDYATIRISGDGAMSTNSLELIRIKVVSIAAGTVIFDDTHYYLYTYSPISALDIGGYWVRVNEGFFTGGGAIPAATHSNYLIGVYGSPTDGNYVLSATVMIGGTGWTTSLGGVGSATANYGWFPQQLVTLADWYDDTAGFVKFPADLTSLASQNELLIVSDGELLYYSSVSAGASPEMIEPTNTLFIGSTADGLITGLFSNEDFLFIGKEKEIYYLLGTLSSGSVKVRPFRTTGIGCINQAMIGSFASWPVFLSQRGFYHCKTAGDIDEISELIETAFTENRLGTLTPYKYFLDVFREYLHFVFQEKILSYHYKSGEWVVLEDMPCLGGLDLFQKKMWMVDTDGVLYYESGDLDKECNKIEIEWASNWEHGGEPSLEKKFQALKIFSLNPLSPSFDIDIAFQKDWEVSNIDTKTLDFSTKRFQMCRPTIATSFSFRTLITNRTPGKKVILTGWEYEVELTQTKIKQ